MTRIGAVGLVWALAGVLLSGLGAPAIAEEDVAPAGEPACHDPAADERLVEEQRADERRQRLTRLDTAYGQRLATALPARLDALVVGQRLAREAWTFRVARRATESCLGASGPDPFCIAVHAGEEEDCGQVAPGDEGAVNGMTCRFAAALRAGAMRGDSAPCETLEGALGQLCGMALTGRYACEGLGEDDAHPIRGLCRLLEAPGRCPRDDPDAAQRCALEGLFRRIRGEDVDCAAIPADRFPRLRSACRVVAGDEPRCPAAGGSAGSKPAKTLDRCLVAAPWAPEVTRRARAVSVSVPVANVLSHELRCRLETRLRGPDGDDFTLPEVTLPPVPAGQARVFERTVPLAPDAVGTLSAAVYCERRPTRPGATAELAPFAGVSLPDPGAGEPPK